MFSGADDDDEVSSDVTSLRGHGDQVLGYIGDVGRYQAGVIFGIITIYVSSIISWQTIVMTFHIPHVDHICKPKVNCTGMMMEQCLNEELNYHQWQAIALQFNTSMLTCEVMIYTPGESLAPTTEKCSEWVYDESVYRRTVTSDFDFVCDRRFLASLSQSIFLLGNALGVLTGGFLADKIGRKWSFLFFSVCVTGFTISSAFSPTDYAYIILRFISGWFVIGAYTIIYVYGMEHFGGKYELIYGIGFQLPWAVAYCFLPLIAYGIPDWVLLQVTISVPLALFIPIGICMPESPKWCLSKGKVEEAEKIVKTIVKFNKRISVDDVKMEPLKSPSVETLDAKFVDLFKTRNLRKVTLIQYFAWFSTSCVYYGLTLNNGTLVPDASLYLNVLIGGLVEIPAYILTIILLLFYHSRRILLSGSFFLGGIALFLILTVMDNDTWALVFAGIGKFGLTASFAVVYLYAAEIFPTVVRTSGLGSSSMWARIGAILAPILGGYLGEFNRVIPILIFAILACTAGFMTLLLPETGDKKLPDTIEEGEKFASEDVFILANCWNKIRGKNGDDRDVTPIIHSSSEEDVH